MRKILPSFFSLFYLFSLHSEAQTFNEILGRPTDKSVTISALFSQIVEVKYEFGAFPTNFSESTALDTSLAETPVVVDLGPLQPDKRYYYRTVYRPIGSANFKFGPVRTFHTQRLPGATFSFTVEADEHLYDKKGVRSLYQICLQNQARDSADFMLSLGDIFGDDHTPTTTTSADMAALHLDYRQYLGEVCHSLPFFVCLGNHEGESGYYLDQTPPNNIAVYGTKWRKFYYPNPFPNSFYSGNMVEEPNGIGLPENYFAWTWGDALFVVLDVYRDCDVNEKPQKWDWTLGKTQYDWLKNTLESSPAKHKFVFAHHNRGQGRGGITPATGFEWGGMDAGQDKFDEMRPGWGQPIHQMMVANGVDIFFQGHDHLFAKEELDGLVYQEVPMPSDSTYEIGVLANADAYTDLTLDGSGHLRVTVAPECVTVDYVAAYLPKDTLGSHKNREIRHSYQVCKVQNAVENPLLSTKNDCSAAPNPAHDRLTFRVKTAAGHDRPVTLFDLQGRPVRKAVLGVGETSCVFELQNLPPGIYSIRVVDDFSSNTLKVIVLN